MLLLARDEIVEELARLACDANAAVVFGPFGIGKSSILAEVVRRIRARGVPCGFSPHTETLREVIRGLDEAYPGLAACGAGRRQLRNRLRLAAEAQPGALVLDHLWDESAAMKGLIRYARILNLGLLVAVDAETPRDRAWLRSLKLSPL